MKQQNPDVNPNSSSSADTPDVNASSEDMTQQNQSRDPQQNDIDAASKHKVMHDSTKSDVLIVEKTNNKTSLID